MVRRKVFSQNFLVDRRVIDALADSSGVRDGDLVLDIGAGNGLITEALRRRGARVIAIERDPALARRLRAKFGAGADVTVVEDDVLTTPLPREPFRVVANIPFGITTKILRRLLGDAGGMLRRADVIVQAEVARKRAAPPARPGGARGGGTLLNACWEPWFEFRMGTRIPPSAFRPQPQVETAVLIVTRRGQPLLDPVWQRDYAAFVTSAFENARPTVASAVTRPGPRWRALTRPRFATIAGELGFGAAALPGHLSVDQWVGLFLAARAGSGDAAGRRGRAR